MLESITSSQLLSVWQILFFVWIRHKIKNQYNTLLDQYQYKWKFIKHKWDTLQLNATNTIEESGSESSSNKSNISDGEISDDNTTDLSPDREQTCCP